MNTHSYLLLTCKSQITLFQTQCHLGNLPQRFGNPFCQIYRQKQHTDRNGDKAHHRDDIDHMGCPLLCIRRWKPRKNQAVDIPILVFCGYIGTQIIDPQYICLAHITLPLLQHDLFQICGQLRPHHTLTILHYRAVLAGISLKNGKFATHFLLHLIQDLIHILAARQHAKSIRQHICTIDTALLLHSCNQIAKHIYTYCHRHHNKKNLHDCHHTTDFHPKPHKSLTSCSICHLVSTHYSFLRP